MNSYHFDLGNSTDGPIGFCARVTAESAEAAIEILKEALPESVEIGCHDETGSIEYLAVYLNADAITLSDIDEEDEIND